MNLLRDTGELQMFSSMHLNFAVGLEIWQNKRELTRRQMKNKQFLNTGFSEDTNAGYWPRFVC